MCSVLCAMDIGYLVLLKKIMGGELDSIGNAIWGEQEKKLGVVFK